MQVILRNGFSVKEKSLSDLSVIINATTNDALPCQHLLQIFCHQQQLTLQQQLF